MILMKKFVSVTTVAIEIGKTHFFNDQWKMLQEEKYLFKNMNLADSNYHWKNWVDWILDSRKSHKCTFWEKEPIKFKKKT